MAESEMLIDDTRETIPFQLQFDNPVASEIKIAEWNPEKDLLAMVTDESKIVLHRFNWQRLWTTSLGKRITAICWRPDGKVLAIGLEDGSISLHDVESGKVLKQVKLHKAAIVCLKWEIEDEVGEFVRDEKRNIFRYEDRTSRFFPPAPRIPQISGVGSGDPGSMENNEDSSQELLNFSLQRFNLLCSGDQDGSVCFSIFGIFPIGSILKDKAHLPHSWLPLRNTCSACRRQHYLMDSLTYYGCKTRFYVDMLERVIFQHLGH